MRAAPSSVDLPPAQDRTDEWFVPRFGPRRFRVIVGLLFVPYTGMVLAFTVLGATLAPRVDGERVLALILIYILALGIGAHALDAVGGRSKPWGDVLGRRALKATAALALGAAYAIGAWYMQRYAPWLWPVAIAEGILLLAYNLEWFEGRFHTDAWFAISWGALPALAGYLLQTNSLAASAIVLAAGTAGLSLVEITASRPYKAMRQAARRGEDVDRASMRRLEVVLQALSLGTIALAAAAAFARWENGGFG